MRYLALATDYDGTLAADGVVRERTLAALERLRKSGRRAILVTGRELEDLRRGVPRLDPFGPVGAEDGAPVLTPPPGPGGGPRAPAPPGAARCRPRGGR